MNGLFDSVRQLLAGVIAAAQTRLELVTTELAAEVQRAVGVLLWAAVALFFGGLAVLMIAITIVVAAPESRRLLVAGIVCAVFLAIAIGAALIVRRRVSQRAPLLAATLGELRKDREALERGLAPTADPEAPPRASAETPARTGAGAGAGSGAGTGTGDGFTSARPGPPLDYPERPE
ncbi:MAG: phage holin family protein [Steroidobacteraceae bacterium]